jgi:hypothetical protein
LELRFQDDLNGGTRLRGQFRLPWGHLSIPAIIPGMLILGGILDLDHRHSPGFWIVLVCAVTLVLGFIIRIDVSVQPASEIQTAETVKQLIASAAEFHRVPDESGTVIRPKHYKPKY